MKRLVEKLAAVFCLVSMGICSKGNIHLKESFPSVGYSHGLLTMKDLDSVAKPTNGSTSKVFIPDWKKAPNSYIFDPGQNSEGLWVPVRKAYAMWEGGGYLNGTGIPQGTVTADVLWEDVHGLIKSGANYALEVEGSGQSAKIKVPINKSKKGNAVIALKVNGEVYWSWHIWVTDDPANGSSYKSFDNIKRVRSDGTTELIPNTEWQWMDRNLGALTSSITSSDWNRSGGLLYQWGRKDPIPPLVTRGNDFYEASGSIGRVRHRGAKNLNNAASIDDLRKFVLFSNAEVTNNIRLSVKNPLSLIYVNKDDNSGQAYYNNNLNLPVNWFGKTASLPDNRLSELNLWSDNAQGVIDAAYNTDDSAKPYRDKSSYDPCPNGWRIPSMLVANLASSTYVDDVRIDFSPFGVRTNMGRNTFDANKYNIIKPTDAGVPGFMTGFKIYPNMGFDLSNVGGYNMGIFPGTGQLIRGAHLGQYSDQHHIALWTATMARQFDATPAVGVRGLSMIPDKTQPDIPDPGYPDIKGRYFYFPLAGMYTSDANGCRCIKDPLYVVNDYDFPTEYLPAATEYKEGLNNPNTYQIVKSTSASVINIPVSKAFSVQSQLLNNSEILNPSNFNNLKANVLWTTNIGLISKVSIINPSPGSVQNLGSSRINVEIAPNQSGNAVITLHNGSISAPVYWSWHIWVTDTPVGAYTYTTEPPVAQAVNYMNYVNKADAVLQTTIMDRNLGATDSFPSVANPLTPTASELARIRASTGLHYQWGRKDPIPTFQNADNRGSFSVFLGSVSASGTVSYTTLSPAAYNDLAGSYIVPYNTYASTSNVQAADKPNDKVSKIISYSVKNPLVYMIPSVFAPFNSATPNYTNGTDWLSTEPNLAPERWGRGSTKSPFDPCPEGWRIPDVTNVALVSGADFGQTPWYKKDKNIATSYSAITDYSGVRVRNPSTTATIGYMFNDPSYRVGNYPNSGSRGFRSVTGNQPAQGTFNTINFQYPGVWMDALNANYIGRPVSILFDAASSANRFIAFHDNNDPYFGMNCRCAKIEYDSNGNEEGPASRMTVVFNDPSLSTSETKASAKGNSIEVYPNPVDGTLYIKSSGNKEYQYQIYSISGQLVKSGKFENKQTDISSLVSGVYVMRINNSEAVVKIIKR
ncbi:T9SS C-terminal target domain-containing protein [Chryseobacterium lactis]|uniref:T9SS C-terminal target domain-containing protein n=1 Tax=Chryseobacterium lactis TaxID=1241981 RepID=A0A3G6RRX8_CHRLC|nr:T9SS type A sorting domain-containing protein [Chryseobacterium lactis]AZA81018.1 T9SS C-terminal target domain-containing protein [Chryseobacterium lactis]AZB06019.1 T9SS C-terminal target domain-containing protein [Chryseobacterium lactis]PNW14868.1 T9SS C-terminal target domain-containing protein [Chryseobacterium lactis]